MPRRQWSLEEARALRESGWTFAQIAERLGVSGESTIRQALRAPREVAPPAPHRTQAAMRATRARWTGATPTPQTRRTTPPAEPHTTRTFGVEIEFHTAIRADVARAVEEVVGYHIHMTNYHGNTCVTCGQAVQGYRQWKLETDSSATSGMANAGAYPHNQGGELVSPVLSGEAGLREVKAVMQALRSVNAKVDQRHGMHIHIGVMDLSPEQRCSFFHNYGVFQQSFYDLVANSRYSNRYCRPVRESVYSYWEQQSRAGRAIGGDHTDGLNVTNLTRIGTVEFRMHQGTLNGTKAVNWIKLLVAFTDAAKNGHRAREYPLAPTYQSSGVVRADLVQWLRDLGLITEDHAEYLKRRRRQLRPEVYLPPAQPAEQELINA